MDINDSSICIGMSSVVYMDHVACNSGYKTGALFHPFLPAL